MNIDEIDWDTITPEELAAKAGYSVAKAKEQLAIMRGDWGRDVIVPHPGLKPPTGHGPEGDEPDDDATD